MTHRREVGSEVDGFKLERLMHCGSMSELWQVSRAGAAVPLVMKMPVLTRGSDPAAIVAFEVEQMILPALRGPHVPRFVAAGDFSGEPHIVMELIEGESVRALLDRAPLEPQEVAWIGAAVAEALHDVHRQHVIHFDLKPSNVILRNGKAVLLDFGLARHDRLPDLLAEEFRSPIGTGPYIAPEQVMHLRNDARSDIFALGVMLYHLATGTRPFGNPTTAFGLRHRLYGNPVPPRALVAACPPWLQEIVLRCLAVDPAERYDTAAQVALELRHPDQVKLTARGTRTTRDGWARGVRHWLRLLTSVGTERRAPRERLLQAPIIMVALDLARGTEHLAEMLRESLHALVASDTKARIACVTVLRTPRIAMAEALDEEGRNLHVMGLVELRHWAQPLRLAEDQITFHVLEAPDPAAALVQFARANQVDHVLVGARGSSALRRYLGSVSSQVVAEAPCSVTVVRLPEHAENGLSLHVIPTHASPGSVHSA